jgi:tRNA(His) 5'-end guanylyltransferase
MNFDEFDRGMRVFETNADHCVLPHVYIVARLDGRGFTKLTKERHPFEKPFDDRFSAYMRETVEHLMNCGFTVSYAFTQSDEISLLFDLNEDSFGRKVRKFNSVLAGEASAKFSTLLKDHACFDCRICELPRVTDVRDYFRWRQEDAHRNALSAHCYWHLRQTGLNERQATEQLLGLGVSEKNELLFQAGINFNDLPAWQKRGVGFVWGMVEKSGVDPRSGETHVALRRRIISNTNLPFGEEYGHMIVGIAGGNRP